MEELLSAAADEMEGNKQRERMPRGDSGSSFSSPLPSHSLPSSPQDNDTDPSPSSFSFNENSPSNTVRNDGIHTSRSPRASTSPRDHHSTTSTIPSRPTPQSSISTLPPSATPTSHSSANIKQKSTLVSPRNSIRTRSSKRDPPPLSMDSSASDTSQPITSSPSSSSSSSANPPPNPPSSVQPVLACKTPGCIVCLKGPPPSFEKGTPIWYDTLPRIPV